MHRHLGCREIGEVQDVGPAEEHHAGDEVLELADVARPGAAGELIEERGRDGDLAGHAELAEDVIDEG